MGPDITETAATAGDGAEQILGTGSADTIVASDGGGPIFALGGFDIVDGGDGDDVIDGGTGGDTISGAGGNDRIAAGPVESSGLWDADLVFGGAGDDTVDGGADDDTLRGEAGTDRLFGGLGEDVIDGGDGDDGIHGDAGDDTLTGGAGDDMLDGGSGDDRMDGGPGHDTYRFGTGRDEIDEEADPATSIDTLLFGPGLSFGDLRLVRHNDDLVVLAGSEWLRVVDQYSGDADRRVEFLAFDDGARYDLTTGEMLPPGDPPQVEPLDPETPPGIPPPVDTGGTEGPAEPPAPPGSGGESPPVAGPGEVDPDGPPDESEGEPAPGGTGDPVGGPGPEPEAPGEPSDEGGRDPAPEAPSDMPAPILSVAATEVGGLSDAARLSHKDAYALETGTLAFTVTADGVSGRQGLVSKDAEFLGEGGHLTIWLEDGEITARLQSDEESYELHGGSVEAGKAASVAVSFGEGGFRLFVDGAEVDRSDYAGGLETNGEPIVIGASAWASRDGAADALTHEFKGEIADLGLYGEALSPDAIRSLAGVTDGAPQEPVEEPEEPVDAPEEPVTEAPEEPVEEPEKPEEPAEEPEPAPEPEPEPANSAPVLDSASIERSVTEGETDGFALDGIFSDPDGDELQFTLADAPDFVSISDDGRLRLAPGEDDSGSYGFSVTASDGTATSAAFEVTVTVAAASTPGEGPGETPGGGTSGGSGYTPQEVSLTAGLGIVNTNETAPQSWGEGVTLTGYDLDGTMARVGITNQWDDVGFGVQGNGSRWQDQIDYYASGGGRSETLVVDFNGEVTDVVARIGMLGQTEGPNGTPETGTWKAYDGDGNLVDQGRIGPDQSTLGTGVKEGGSYGLFPIAIDADAPFERLELEATQFDYGNASSTTESYGENSSDYNLVGLDFLRLEPSDDILV